MSRSFVRRWTVLVLIAPLAACGGARGGSTVPEPVEPSEDAKVSSPARSDEVRPRNGLEVVGAMRRAHPSRALNSVSFSVDITDFRTDSAPRSRKARAVASLPGKYRVTNLPTSRQSGIVRDQHRLAVFERGRRVVSQSRVDLTMLLGYDIFAQGIDSTIKWLDVARVRFGLVRRDEFDGQRVWVVGAFEEDTTSSQFWVDAEAWRVVRVIQRDPRRPDDLVDVRFREFVDVLGIPVPTRIDIHRAGRLVQQQIISDLAANPTVPLRAFDLARWRTVALGN